MDDVYDMDQTGVRLPMLSSVKAVVGRADLLGQRYRASPRNVLLQRVYYHTEMDATLEFADRVIRSQVRG